jgi:hypothetical protein
LLDLLGNTLVSKEETQIDFLSYKETIAESVEITAVPLDLPGNVTALTGDSDGVVRSVNRVLSLGDVESDSSIGFRLTSHLRLFENITQLGVGTFSDSNYFNFFRSDDFWLMNINPHSYLVEYSFLFGNNGFALILLVFIFILSKILLNFEIRIIFRIVAAIGLIFIQAVPSSMLTEIYFLISM